jgi:hypothetical protein
MSQSLQERIAALEAELTRKNRTWGQWGYGVLASIDWPSFTYGVLTAGLLITLTARGCELPTLPINWPSVVNVEPAPFAGDGLMMLIVEETEDRDDVYTPAQVDVLTSSAPQSVRGYMAEQAVKIAGQPAFRVLDKDSLKDLSRDQKWVQDAAKAVDTTKLPYAVVSNGKSGAKFQVVDTPSTLEQLKKLVK